MVILSEEQAAALALVQRGHSIFLTGEAGTGKSTVLRQMKRALFKLYPKQVYVTGSTGVAACNIGGMTIHKFSGIGCARGDVQAVVGKAMHSKTAEKYWRKAKVLIIDEVSMLSAKVWTILDTVAKVFKEIEVRGAGKLPFGGIQVIAVGDFYQLPPVQGKFAFESDAWTALFPPTRVVRLHQIFRQTDADPLLPILHRARMGRLQKEDVTALVTTGGSHLPDLEKQGIEPTMLFTHNKQVDEYNMKQLRALSSTSGAPITEYKSTDEGTTSYVALLKKQCRAPTTLALCVGAQVMLLKNLNVQAGLVNGTRGIVTGVDEETDTPTVRFLPHRRAPVTQEMDYGEWDMTEGEKVVARRKQYPLCLAWAISVHKSQGMTIGALALDISGCFAPGQAYVALSRATALDCVKVAPFRRAVVRTSPAVVAYEAELDEALLHSREEGGEESEQDESKD